MRREGLAVFEAALAELGVLVGEQLGIANVTRALVRSLAMHAAVRAASGPARGAGGLVPP